MSNFKVWALKTVADKDRALQTVDSYGDEIEHSYNYDSKVANFKQIQIGDYAILVNKVKVLGIARIEDINIVDHRKTIRRCQECESTTIDKRKKLTPVYRCNKGHEFDEPREFDINVRKYSARFNGTFKEIANEQSDLMRLRSLYASGYNQNMSMQLLDNRALDFLPKISTDSKLPKILGKNEYSLVQEPEEPYLLDNKDERTSKEQISKQRKGQKVFKNRLIKRYGEKCMITGCEIPNILHASHIYPYRGPKHNNPANGLLLRVDIHVLFDLNLIAINPDNFQIHFHHTIADEYKIYNRSQLHLSNQNKPAENVLQWRWAQFEDIQIEDISA